VLYKGVQLAILILQGMDSNKFKVRW